MLLRINKKILLSILFHITYNELLDVVGNLNLKYVLFVPESYDFIAFNYYDSYKVRPMTKDEFKAEKYLLNKDLGVQLSSNADNMDDVILL